MTGKKERDEDGIEYRGMRKAGIERDDDRNEFRT